MQQRLNILMLCLFPGKLVVVSDAQCGHNKPSPQSRACQERECDAFRGLSDNELPTAIEQPAIINTKKEWNIGSWSQCSVTCGTGHRTRSVICPSGQCHPENRPAHAEYCNQGPCESPKIDTAQSQPKPTLSSRSSHSSSFASWLVTEWSHCSEQCGKFCEIIINFNNSINKIINRQNGECFLITLITVISILLTK